MDSLIVRIQKEEIVILDEIVRLCEKHRLTYFLAGGTLLGAVRHQGFIPWDDDLDIMMPREDYNKFLSIAKRELKNDFVLQHHTTDRNYWLPFAKIRKRNTVYDEVIAQNNIEEKGFWVDVFPLDYSRGADKKTEKIKRFLLTKLTNIILANKLLTNQYNLHQVPRRSVIRRNILKAIGFDNKECLILHTFIASSKRKKPYIVNQGSKYGIIKQTMPTDFYFPATKLSFAGKEYSVPNQYKKVLEHIYGADYMQLPPEEKREIHMAARIQFSGESEIRTLGENYV